MSVCLSVHQLLSVHFCLSTSIVYFLHYNLLNYLLSPAFARLLKFNKHKFKSSHIPLFVVSAEHDNNNPIWCCGCWEQWHKNYQAPVYRIQAVPVVCPSWWFPGQWFTLARPSSHLSLSQWEGGHESDWSCTNSVVQPNGTLIVIIFFSGNRALDKYDINPHTGLSNTLCLVRFVCYCIPISNTLVSIRPTILWTTREGQRFLTKPLKKNSEIGTPGWLMASLFHHLTFWNLQKQC